MFSLLCNIFSHTQDIKLKIVAFADYNDHMLYPAVHVELDTFSIRRFKKNRDKFDLSLFLQLSHANCPQRSLTILIF